MGYLADIVFDARDRKAQDVYPTCLEQVTELCDSPETRPATDIAATVKPGTFPGAPMDIIERGAAVSSDERQMEKKIESDPASQRSTPGPENSPRPVNLALHQHLLQLSRQTLVDRSQQILARRDTRETLVVEKGHQEKPLPATEVSPEAIDHDSPSVAGEHQTKPLPDKTGRPESHHVQKNLTERYNTACETHLNLSRQDNHVSLYRQSVHTHSHVTGETPGNRALAVPREAATIESGENPLPRNRDVPPTREIPQLRIGQITVVVESVGDDRRRQSSEERGSDSASRYFLRGL